MARKWQRLAAMKGKRISFPRATRDVDTNSCSTSTAAAKSHFVVHTTDRRRFAAPLVHLGNEAFRELLKMSEEEFGISSDGPTVLHCDSFFLEYIFSLIRRGDTRDLQKALLMSVAAAHCSSFSTFHLEQILNQQLLVC